jgi:hypothetical protein
LRESTNTGPVVRNTSVAKLALVSSLMFFMVKSIVPTFTDPRTSETLQTPCPHQPGLARLSGVQGIFDAPGGQ